MKIDRIVPDFFETYDEEAIKSIDTISNNFGLNANGVKFKAFNINEAFARFKEYLEGYSAYKCKTVLTESVRQDDIKANVDKFIDTYVFEDKEIEYKELSGFVKTYLEKVDELAKTADKIKFDMRLAGVELESVGDVNEFVDKFTDELQFRFKPVMERALWASGYRAKQHQSKKLKPVFL